MRILRLVVPALLVTAAARGEAQLVNGSTRGAGMADAYGAVARGAAAGFYNPALLGLRDNPGFTLTLPNLTVQAGAAPIGLNEAKTWGGLVVPDSVKRRWLSLIPNGGTQTGSVFADLAGLGLNIGPLAINVSTIVQGDLGIPKGAVDLLLFGNVDSLGNPRSLSFANGSALGFGVGVVSASLGFPIWSQGKGPDAQRIAIGVTGKYVGGLGYGNLWGTQGNLAASPIAANLTFPVVLNYKKGGFGLSGTGLGLDVGIAYQQRDFTLAVAVTDLYNGFKWDSTNTRIVNGRAYITADSTNTFTKDTSIYDPSVPAALKTEAQRRIGLAVFKPTYRASLAYKPSSRLLLSADLVRRTADTLNLQFGPTTTLAAGAELRLLPILPLRGGVAVMDGGTMWTVGTGLEFSVFNVNVAYGRRTGDIGRAERVSVGLSFGNGR